MKSKLMLLVALVFGAAQARGPSIVDHSARFRTAASCVASSLGDALPADSLNCHLVSYLHIPGVLAQVRVEGNTACVARGALGLCLVDVSDPANPQIVGTEPPLNSTAGVDVDGHYAYVAELNYFAIIDISNPSSPARTASVYSPGALCSVTKAGDYAYASDYGMGIRIFDVSDPDTVFQVGSVAGVGGMFQIPSMPSETSDFLCVDVYDTGLNVFDVSDPSDPSLVGLYDAEFGACEWMTARDSIAYLAELDAVSAIDISDPENPVRVGRGPSSGSHMYSVALHGNFIYGASSSRGIQVLNISDPTDMTLAGYYKSDIDGSWWLDAANGYCYALGDSGLLIVQYAGDTGAEEDRRTPAFSLQLTTTIVRGVLFLTGDSRLETGDRAALLDAAGRRVVELQPGPNDVQHLSPGVYFVSTPKSVGKLVLTR